MSLTGGTSVPSLGKVAFRDIAAVPMRFWRPPQEGARLPGGVVFPPDAPRWVHMPLLGGKVWAEGPPSDPPEAAPLPGRYAFVGPTAHHFGHMCAEFLHRLWVLRDDPDLVPLLVNAEPARPQIPRFVRDYLRLIGAREPVLVTHPVRIEELVVGEPGRIYRTTCTAAYGRLAGGLLPAALIEPSGQARHLAVLRGHLQTGRCLGEAWIEAHLVAAGYRAFHPEKHTIEEQIAAVMGAERIVFSEGSALHLLDLLPPLRAQVAVIGRRPGMALVRHSLEEKAARLSLYRPPFMIGSLSKRGRRASALTFLDPADVLRFLAEHGFIDLPAAAGFLDDDELVRADIAAYAHYWRRTSGDGVAAAFVDAAMACCRSRKPEPQLALTLRPLEDLARSPPLRWSPKFGQVVKLGSPARRTDPDDGQADAIFGGVQGEGGAGGAAG
jgi:hypothetical protein